MVAQYCKEVKAAIQGDDDYKNSVIKNLEADLVEYISDHPDATAQNIRAYFGAPEDYARELDATLSPSEKEQRKTLRRRVLTAAVAALVAALLIWAGAVVSATVEANTRTNNHLAVHDIS